MTAAGDKDNPDRPDTRQSRWHHPVSSRLGRYASFALAGGAGFVVDLAVLRGLIELADFSPFAARIPAIAAAMTTTWLINRTFTFGKSGRSVGGEATLYALVALAGAVLNYAIYSVVLVLTPDWFLPEMATFVAVACVTVFSWFGYSRLVFKSR